MDEAKADKGQDGKADQENAKAEPPHRDVLDRLHDE
jgi:hypothetical protein